MVNQMWRTWQNRKQNCCRKWCSRQISKGWCWLSGGILQYDLNVLWASMTQRDYLSNTHGKKRGWQRKKDCGEHMMEDWCFQLNTTSFKEAQEPLFCKSYTEMVEWWHPQMELFGKYYANSCKMCILILRKLWKQELELFVSRKFPI